MNLRKELHFLFTPFYQHDMYMSAMPDVRLGIWGDAAIKLITFYSCRTVRLVFTSQVVIKEGGSRMRCGLSVTAYRLRDGALESSHLDVLTHRHHWHSQEPTQTDIGRHVTNSVPSSPSHVSTFKQLTIYTNTEIVFVALSWPWRVYIRFATIQIKCKNVRDNWQVVTLSYSFKSRRSF